MKAREKALRDVLAAIEAGGCKDCADIVKSLQGASEGVLGPIQRLYWEERIRQGKIIPSGMIPILRENGVNV